MRLLNILEPSFRPERQRIRRIELRVSLNHVRVARDIDSRGDSMAVDDLRFGYSPGEEIGGGRVQAEAFFDACDEIWQLDASFFVLDWIRQLAVLLGRF